MLPDGVLTAKVKPVAAVPSTIGVNGPLALLVIVTVLVPLVVKSLVAARAATAEATAAPRVAALAFSVHRWGWRRVTDESWVVSAESESAWPAVVQK